MMVMYVCMHVCVCVCMYACTHVPLPLSLPLPLGLTVTLSLTRCAACPPGAAESLCTSYRTNCHVELTTVAKGYPVWWLFAMYGAR